MEALLQYVWKHKMFPLGQLATVDGRAVEVIDTGLQNTDAGPDFFNAKVKIGGTVWVGNVELHDKSSAWTAHGHDRDHAYDNVVLHVATEIDADVATAGGRVVPQMRLEVPPAVAANYEALLSIDRYPPCFAVIPRLDSLTVHGWMSRLVAERLEQKTAAIMRRVELCVVAGIEGLVAQKIPVCPGIKKGLVGSAAPFPHREGQGTVGKGGFDLADQAGQPLVREETVLPALEHKCAHAQLIALAAAVQDLILRKPVAADVGIAPADTAVETVVPAEVGELDQPPDIDIPSVVCMPHLAGEAKKVLCRLRGAAVDDLYPLFL